MSGHWSGLAAEEAAGRLYAAEGGTLLATRWRCTAGEIDLIVGLPGEIVFVEVKARRDHGLAAGAVSPAQWRRLAGAAAVYLEAHPGTNCRFDLVLVDRAGRVERLVNAASFDEF